MRSSIFARDEASLFEGPFLIPHVRGSRTLLILRRFVFLAALAAQGDSVIHNVGQIDRGYERIDERLQALGAQIERVDGTR